MQSIVEEALRRCEMEKQRPQVPQSDEERNLELLEYSLLAVEELATTQSTDSIISESREQK